MTLIKLQNINKEYILKDEKVSVLKNVSVEIRQGEFIAIMGPSGSGKSTLMNILGCLDQPTSGKYVFANKRVDSLGDEELSHIRNHEIGFIFQQFNLLTKNSALANIILPLVYQGKAKKERITQGKKAASLVGIEQRIQHRPSELSGGQAQRVAIARAILTRPRLLLADEPTGSLDSKTGKEIMDIFEKLHQQGHTIVMVTHNIDVAKKAKRILHIADGIIVREELFENKTYSLLKDNNKRPGKNLHWIDLLAMAFRGGILMHPLRSILAMLGVLFGVASVISMIAINEGARQRTLEQIQSMGLNNIRIRNVKMTREDMIEAHSRMSQGLNMLDIRAIKQLPSILYIAPIRYLTVNISQKATKISGKILGTSPEYKKVHSLTMAQGRFLNTVDIKKNKRICVLSEGIKIAIFGAKPALQKNIFLGTEIFTVVGVVKVENNLEGMGKVASNKNNHFCVYIPFTSAKKRFAAPSFRYELDEVSMMVQNSSLMKTTSNILHQLIATRHHQVKDYKIVMAKELLEQEQETQKVFDIVMVCIASISLLVGGIGIMNIMLATVTERTKEIGIRRAIGANTQQIIRQFVFEAIVISGLGGALGITMAWGITTVVSAYTGWYTVISLPSILLGFAVASFVGLVFGIYPAYKASKIDPIKALNSV